MIVYENNKEVVYSLRGVDDAVRNESLKFEKQFLYLIKIILMKKKYTIELPKDIEIKSSNIFNGLKDIELSFKNENSILYIDSEDKSIIAINAYNESKNNYSRDTLKSKGLEYSKIVLDKNYNMIELFLDGYPNENPIVLREIK